MPTLPIRSECNSFSEQSSVDQKGPKAVFEKLEPQSLRDRALNALKHAFFSGELRPGDASSSARSRSK